MDPSDSDNSVMELDATEVDIFAFEYAAQSTETNSDVHLVEYKLPMSFSFPQKRFYARKCYDEYYGYIIDTLNDPFGKYISLTGTPGKLTRNI
jgi:hypothetical protein